MLSFDITDRHVRIIRGNENHGKIKVFDAHTIDIDEGLIVNGHIKDIPKMATIINTALKSKKMADKEAVISISSNLIIFKELRIPSKTKDLLGVVQNQMQHTMGISDDYSISYTIAGEVDEDGTRALKVLATACPFEVVDCFRKVFSMLGIALRSVAVSCNTISRIILSDAKSKAKMPMLLVQIDPNFVSLNLYEDNQLTFSRFATIDPEDYENPDDYIYEAVNENIFRMFQFQKSRNGDNPIQNVVFYGDTSEYIRLTNALEQMDISTSLLGVPSNIGGYENFEFQAYANAIGAMFRSNKETERINLIEVDAAVGRTNVGSAFALSVFGAVLVSAAVVGAVWLFGYIQENQYNNEISEIQETLNSGEKKEKSDMVDDVQSKLNRIKNVKKVVDAAYDNYNSLPVLNTKLIEDIYKNFEGTGADIKTIGFGNGAMNLECVASTVDEPSEVVANFFEQDIFKNVTYTGFTSGGSDEENSTANEYSFTISFDVPEVEKETEAEDDASATN